MNAIISKRWKRVAAALAAAICLSAAGQERASSPAESHLAVADNTLSAQEKAAGWMLLFDGKTADGWRNFHKQTFPDHGWAIHDGILTCVAGGHGGDLITDRTFDDFDLQWDWMLPAGANNGIKYFITEERKEAIGHEYQMIDDAIVKGHPKQSTASFYDVLAPDPDKPLRPVGQWNRSEVIVRGNQVEHWLNGKRVLHYELNTPELRAEIAKSKFRNVPGFGTHIRGHILLTEHHDEASFKNIKIREIPNPKSETN